MDLHKLGSQPLKNLWWREGADFHLGLFHSKQIRVFPFFFWGGRGLCKNRALKETEVHRGMKLQKAEASCSLMIKHQILRVPSIAAFLIVVL